jgi:hypothetical protein
MRPLSLIVLIGVAGFVSGCAEVGLQRIPAGTPAAQVMAAAGPPSEQRTLANGVKAWYYESGPLGRTTYRTLFDASDRLIGVEQVLSESHFRTVVANRSSRDDVLDLFGRPGLIARFPNLGEEVWTYRYRDDTVEMVADDHFDIASGTLRYCTLYPDPAYASQGRE